MSDVPTPTPGPGARAPLSRRLLLLVVDHNPFYILSAVCMLAGCLTLTNATTHSPFRAGQLLALVLTLNAYELLLVGLGLYLIVRRGVRRDGMFLLLIEFLFLVDMASLNAEAYSLNLRLGVAVNVLVFALAAGKLYAIFRALKFPLGDGLLAMTLAQLLVIFGTPGVLARVALPRDGRLGPWVMYAGWWAVGLLPVVYALVVRPRNLLTLRTGNVARDVLSKVLLVAPLVSAVVHLATAQWVYRLDFTMANVSPLLLGLAVMAGHYDDHAATYGRRVRRQLVLPALAVLFSMGVGDWMTYAAPGPDWSPLRVALLATVLVYLDGLMVHRHGIFGYGAGLCGMAFGLGATPAEMGETLSRGWGRAIEWFDRGRPRTARAWGVVSVVASFVLLGIGFGVSLLRGRVSAVAVENGGDTAGTNPL